MAEKENRYFIALIPPPPACDHILKLKQYVAEKYATRAALRSPPHITLHMPFRFRGDRENELAERLAGFATSFEPFKVCLDNYDCFPPRVLFIGVAVSEALNQFQKVLERYCRTEFNLLNANRRDEPYHPHLTLAFRDLKKDKFKEAWEEFRNLEYKAAFMADRFALLKHDGQRWNVFREFIFDSSWSTDTREELATTEG